MSVSGKATVQPGRFVASRKVIPESGTGWNASWPINVAGIRGATNRLPGNKPARLRSAAPFQPKRMAFSHAAIDRRNARQDHLVAARLRQDRRILRRARANLNRWMARDGKRVRPVFAEWCRLLECLSANELADFLISDTPLARRLRQSSPFAGLLTASGPKGPRRPRSGASCRRPCGRPAVSLARPSSFSSEAP